MDIVRFVLLHSIRIHSPQRDVDLDVHAELSFVVDEKKRRIPGPQTTSAKRGVIKLASAPLFEIRKITKVERAISPKKRHALKNLI